MIKKDQSLCVTRVSCTNILSRNVFECLNVQIDELETYSHDFKQNYVVKRTAPNLT